jgi:DNA replication protein DnaC
MNDDRVSAIGIPRDVANHIGGPDFDASRPAVRAAVDFFAAPRPAFLFTLAGTPGAGKSVAAAAAILGARRPARSSSIYIDGEVVPFSFPEVPLPGRWVHARELWHAIWKEDRWAVLGRAAALVIDDVGSEPEDARATPLIASLLCERVDNGRKTLITTNMDPAAFLARYGARVVDRMSNGWHGIVGPSLRGLERGR